MYLLNVGAIRLTASQPHKAAKVSGMLLAMHGLSLFDQH